MGFTSFDYFVDREILNKNLKEEHYMFGFIKKIFGAKEEVAAPVVDTKVEAVNQAPYKVEAVKIVPAEVAVQAVVASTAPAKKPAAKKQQFAKKPQAPKPAAASKAPRKPKSKPAA